MIKVGIIGHFGKKKNLLNGQTIKTKILADTIEKKIGQDQVITFDTHGGFFAMLKLPFQMAIALKKAANLIIMPGIRGIQIIAPLLLMFNKRRKRKIHYVVIGGWLPSLCAKKTKLAKSIKRFDCVYVETTTLKNSLNNMGFSNVAVMPNFKNLELLEKKQLKSHLAEPFRICTFSRVMREKGIEDIAKIVEHINTKMQKTVYCLDIYGQIDPSQMGWFDSLSSSFPPFVKYRGFVPFDKSVEVIKDYFALVFPTRFYTEGLPGTILDAYSAGVPVIASKWESFDDLIEDGRTGFGYSFNNLDELTALLFDLAKNPGRINALKNNCLDKAKDFAPEKVIDVLRLL